VAWLLLLILDSCIHHLPLSAPLFLRLVSECQPYPPGASKGDGKKKTLYDFALDIKAVHPRKVLLIRVGEFYEALVRLSCHSRVSEWLCTGHMDHAGCHQVNVF
jgi:hypothetical protein